MFLRIILFTIITIIFPDDCIIDSISYFKKIDKTLSELEIKDSIKKPIYFEACELIEIGKDIYGREQYLAPQAAKAFEKMLKVASKENIQLNV